MTDFTMNETVKIDGLKELEKRMIKLGQATAGKHARGALMKGALPIAKEIERQAPVGDEQHTVEIKKGVKQTVDPGYLKSRIRRRSSLRRSKSQRGFGGSTVARVRVGVFKVPYVGHIELGTSNQAANPFIRRSFIAKRGEALRNIITNLRKRIEKAEKN